VLSHDGPDAQAPIATAEQMLLHVSLAGGRAAPAGAAVLARVSQLTRAHSNLPRPERAGRHITPP
jgi:carnitine 3-dehydrogenase